MFAALMTVAEKDSYRCRYNYGAEVSKLLQIKSNQVHFQTTKIHKNP